MNGDENSLTTVSLNLGLLTNETTASIINDLLAEIRDRDEDISKLIKKADEES